jgi:uncharacterized protein (TIGR02646 family)
VRPVDRGDDPRSGGDWDPYRLARNPLGERLGWWCSFCEAPMKLGIQVEHKLPKVHYPAQEFQWNNFLLACPHCNPRKGAPPGFTLEDVLWPDEDNTFRAFAYVDATVSVRPGLSSDVQDVAEATIDMVGLDNVPEPTSSDRDLRFYWREIAWQKAASAKEDFDANPNNELALSWMIRDAVSTGFFSVWMLAFEGVPAVRKRLIVAFGVAESCFDDTTSAIARPGGRC